MFVTILEAKTQYYLTEEQRINIINNFFGVSDVN